MYFGCKWVFMVGSAVLLLACQQPEVTVVLPPVATPADLVEVEREQEGVWETAVSNTPTTAATVIVFEESTIEPTAILMLPTKDGAALLDGLQAGGLAVPSVLETTITPQVDEVPTAVLATLSANRVVGTDDPTVMVEGWGFAAEVVADPRRSFVKIGFHVGPEGTMSGLSQWMESLDAQGIPFMLKSVGMAGPLLEAQNLRARSGVPHVLVYRRSGDEFELPNYDNDPLTAALEHWQLHKDAFPPELDPAVVWLETINEVDKNRSEWLGAFALETAKLAVTDGFRWAAFGWSTGEPEIRHWVGPEMVRFLQYATDHPEQVAIALHEYSLTQDTILRDYPHLVGRFQQLYWVCDQLGLDRPTVLITEFGWEYEHVAKPAQAAVHIEAAAGLYAAYPEVKGAAIWYLGGGFGQIDTETEQLIAPLAAYAASHYFIHAEKREIDPQIFR